MTRRAAHRVATVAIASVWIAFGFAKVLHLVPWHEQIVARILGEAHAGPLTRLIGVLEILLAAWILRGRWKRASAVLQIVLVAAMNVLEALLAADLLLWGYLNALFAGAFIVLIYVHGWVLDPWTPRAIDPGSPQSGAVPDPTRRRA